MKTIQYVLSDINQVAQILIKEMQGYNIVTLSGPLGAGKTTLTSAILRQLGVKDPVISPTFTYLNKYTTADGRAVFHFDLYRLKNMQEFEQAGFFEYLDQPNSLVFIEWPEIIQSVLTTKVCNIMISSIDQQRRKIEIL